jgi:amino acid transporter
MASRGLNGLSTALSGLAVVFFLVGVVAYSDEAASVRNVAWITVSDYYFGLRCFVGSHTTATTEYARCSGSICNSCEKAGTGAFGLTMAAIVFSALTTVLSAASAARSTKGLQVTTVMTAIVSVTLSLIAVGWFMGSCWNALDNIVNDVKWGPGSVLTLIGVILMGVVVLLQIMATVVGDQGSSPRKDLIFPSPGVQAHSAPSAPAHHLPTAYATPAPSNHGYFSTSNRPREF